MYCYLISEDYIIDFKVFDSGVSNFSDHIPLMLTFHCCKPVFDTNTSDDTTAKSEDNSTLIHLRWDYADLTSYYNYTGRELRSILNTIDIFNSKLDSGVSPEGAASFVLVSGVSPEGVASFVLVSGVSPEGAVDRHSAVSPDGTTAEVHVTNFVNRLYSDIVDVLHGEPFNSFLHVKSLFINFDGAKNWPFLKKVLSIQIVFGKQRVSHAVAESFKIVM